VSNIHRPGGGHGLDDEFDSGQPSRCPTCWSKAKKMFFDPDRAKRRGITLNTVYNDIHSQEHEE